MKGIILAVVLVASAGMIGGCCSDDICNFGTTYVPASTSDTRQCSNCSTCSSCGYDASYTYSGWY
ncbi:MAG TPA: hypothetical protein VHD33_01555 [Legionellaceae bacterium]|nr:hypothetical protein [Legionellaceae bacterium]